MYVHVILLCVFSERACNSWSRSFQLVISKAGRKGITESALASLSGDLDARLPVVEGQNLMGLSLEP